jgi:hypothetical protein
MQTEIYEADAFTGRKGNRLGAFDSDYRFEKNDEFFLKSLGKFRVIMVRLEIGERDMKRELHVLKL